MTKLDKEIQEGLYDPKAVRQITAKEWATKKKHGYTLIKNGQKYIMSLIKGKTMLEPVKVFDPSKQKQFEKQCKAKAHEGKKLKGQQTLTSAVSTSKRLSEFGYDPTINLDKLNVIKGDTISDKRNGRHYKILAIKRKYATIRRANALHDIDANDEITVSQLLNDFEKVIVYKDSKGINHLEREAIKAYDIKGIADSLRRQGIEPDLVDIAGEYDHNLSHSENLSHFKDMLGLGGRRKQGDYEKMAEQFYKAQTIGSRQGWLAHASPEERAAAFARMRETGTLRGYDPKTSLIPTRWYEAMVRGIKKSSDVRNPYAIVKNIWAKLSPSGKAKIRAREAKGEKFKYDLPLPVDKPTTGTGTLRMVKPFKLAEVQVNLRVKDYLSALKSGIFSKMKRQDGTTALVARCKSPVKNVNVFIDKARK